MFSDPVPPTSVSQRKPLFKNPLLYSSSLVLLVLLYIGWIMLSRWQQNRALQRQAEQQRAERQREQDNAALAQLGGKDLAIQFLYVAPNSVHHGDSAQLCYGVANAKTVKLDPPAADVWPSYSRCFDVTPSKTTTYTLTIASASGESKSASVSLAVE